MAIQIKKAELERRGARINTQPVQLRAKLVHDEPPKEDALVAKAISALVSATDNQRAAILLGVSVNEQIASALSAIKRPEGWGGNWNVHITKRDALGRISEVQFSPAKP